MSQANARLRAEVAHLRSCPRNTLSFTSIDARGCNRFHLPEPSPKDFWANYTAGTRMAMELITALRADDRGNDLNFLVHKLEPLWRDSTMRSAFFRMLELAIVEGPSVDELAEAENARLACSFTAPPRVEAVA